MTSPITTSGALDQADRARSLVELWLTIDREAQDEAFARLIAATLHEGPGSALERFAGTGRLDIALALEELDDVQVPLEREEWVDSLGRFILSRKAGS